MQQETILIIDFGGQYKQLIARRVREAGVYSEVVSWKTPLDKILAKKPTGIIFTGGPAAVTDEQAPTISPEILHVGIPILGICYGAQLIIHLAGGKVTMADEREYGHIPLEVNTENPLFADLEKETSCWMSHTYRVTQLPNRFDVSAKTPSCPVAAYGDKSNRIQGVQFHPEVMHTPQGHLMIQNFLTNICKCTCDWQMDNFVEASIIKLKAQIGDKKVLCALSGGVDSSVAAMMIHKAVGNQLTCVFVDNGLLRKDEAAQVIKTFKDEYDINLIAVHAHDEFLTPLAGVIDPERKRKIIGESFIRVFEKTAKEQIGEVDYLVQGTIYADVIESGTEEAAVIKSHHNVGGLPSVVDFKEIIEPLRDLFKDEVRQAGRELGLPDSLVERQPFPGPGLAIRIIGDITKEKIAILQEADYIYRSELKAHGVHPWQFFAVLTNLRSVGVMGDERTYDFTLALRAVTSTDGMTADWYRIPHDVLAHISNRIVNEVKEINRVVYDITSKPPATIEWE